MNVLVFAPHNDDEILGVGGTMRRHIEENDNVYVCEVTSGKMYKTIQQEAKRAHEFLGVTDTYFLNLPVGELRNMAQALINEKFVAVVKRIEPDIVYVPFIGDMHLDHREVVESAMVALRPVYDFKVKEIYMYETLSETGWNLQLSEKSFNPNVWVDISDYFEKKIKSMSYYQSQLKEYPHPRSVEAVEALAKYRGSTVGVLYAESFMLVRKVR